MASLEVHRFNQKFWETTRNEKERKRKFGHKLENGSTKQEPGIEIKLAPANGHYQLMVDFRDGNVDFDTLCMNNPGCAEPEFYSPPEFNQRRIADFLPLGRNARNIHRIQIFLEGKSAFEAGFQLGTN